MFSKQEMEAYDYARRNVADLVKFLEEGERDYARLGDSILRVPGGQRVLELLKRTERLMTEEVPDRSALQEARNMLLQVRRVFGHYYDQLPQRDGLIRRCDAAIVGVPGEGEPSQAPFDVWAIIGEAPEEGVKLTV